MVLFGLVWLYGLMCFGQPSLRLSAWEDLMAPSCVTTAGVILVYPGLVLYFLVRQGMDWYGVVWYGTLSEVLTRLQMADICKAFDKVTIMFYLPPARLAKTDQITSLNVR